MRFYDLNKKGWQWAILLILAFTWGSSFILMKRGLEVYSHSVVAALRISIAFLFLLPFAIRNLKKVEKKYWKYIIASGFLGNGIPAFLFTKAQTEISSSLSGMLNSLTPIFALVVGILLFKTKTETLKIIGVFIGFIGAIGLIVSNGIDIENSKMAYSFFVVLATICYAFSVNIIKVNLKEIGSVVITSIAFVSIGPLAITYLFTTDFITVSTNNSQAGIALFYISILAIFGTAISVVLFNMLIKKTSTLFASSVTYLIPFFAIMWGIIDGEKLNIIQLISLIITIIGVYCINKIQ